MIGTVEGDLHDIGKNLLIATLEGAGFRAVDLGIDVPAARFVEAVREHDPAVVAMSALLSTTMVNIPKTIAALNAAGLRAGRVIAVWRRAGDPAQRRRVGRGSVRGRRRDRRARDCGRGSPGPLGAGRRRPGGAVRCTHGTGTLYW